MFSKFLAKNWDFAVTSQIAWLFAMTSSPMMCSQTRNSCAKAFDNRFDWIKPCDKLLCSQTRNSCAKAFDNRSRSKILKPKKSKGSIWPPPLWRLLGLIRIGHPQSIYQWKAYEIIKMMVKSLFKNFLFVSECEHHNSFKEDDNLKPNVDLWRSTQQIRTRQLNGENGSCAQWRLQ